MKRILACDDFSVHSLEKLRLGGEFEILREKIGPKIREEGGPQAIEKLKVADGLLIRSRTVVDEFLLEQAPNLKVIATATAGYDHIDLKLCKEKNIAVFHTPESQAVSAAEHTILLMLTLMRRSDTAMKLIKQQGQWKQDLQRGDILKGKSLGIVGLGRIGGRVAKIADAFGMKILAYDPYIENKRFTDHNATRVGLMEIFKESDMITFHVPLTEETKTMIHYKVLEEMSNDCYLINTSRGQIMKEEDLYEALRTKTIKAAAIDVFAKEPLPQDSNLRSLPNLVMTPHIGAFTEDAFQGSSDEAIESILGFFKGADLKNKVT